MLWLISRIRSRGTRETSLQCNEKTMKTIGGMAKAVPPHEKTVSHEARKMTKDALIDDKDNLFLQIIPKRTLESVYLSDSVYRPCAELLDEMEHRDLLREKNMEPRNKLLMVGTPGNGKTTLAEALAGELDYPLYIVRYDNIMSDDIGKSADRLGKVFEAVKGKRCALFFDEFDTIGKSRNDQHDNSEFKRLVSSLLVQIDHLSTDVLVMAATNLESALDNAAWRRFQIKVQLERPQREDLTRWFIDYEKKHGFEFGVPAEELAESVYGKSYSDAEELGQSIFRQMIIHPDEDPEEITRRQMRFHKHQKNIF